MTRFFRLTPRAEASLVSIARWTIETFGQDQADLYEAELLDRCGDIVSGKAHRRSCSVLLDGAEELWFVRAGEPFVVFLDGPDEVIVVDILHSRSDLPRHLAALRGHDP